MTVEQVPANELVHYGVKGMKWGVRMRTAREGFQRNRELNKKSRAKDRASRDRQIDAARDRVSKRDPDVFKNVKAEYKADKKAIGSREARKKRAVKLDKLQSDFETARLAKSGRETTQAVLLAVGTVTLKAVVAASLANAQQRR